MKIKIFVLQFRSYYSKTVHVANNRYKYFKTKQDIEKLKMPLRLVRMLFDALKIGSTIFCRGGT